MVDDRLPTRVRVGYALGSLATGAFGTVPGLLLLPYLTDTLGVAAGLGGILVLLPKAWDLVANPLAGRLSDRTVTRLGARRPYLLGGGIAVAVLFAALFAGPARGAAGAAYVTVVFLLTATAYASYQVPYVAMPAELTESATERTRLAGARIVVLALAILVSGALAPAVVDAVGGLAGYRVMGVGVGALIAVGALAAFALTAGAPTGRIATAAGTLRAQLRVAAAHPPFVRLLACFVIQAVAIGTMLAGVRYFADHVLDRPGANSILFACFVGPALVVMPLWTRLGRHLGKRAGYLTASVLFAAGGLLLAAAGALGAGWAYGCTALVGIGYAGQQTFALSMLPDTIAAASARTGRRQAGVFTGLWTAGETLGLALGPGVFGLLLSATGYVSSTGGGVPQPASARTGILVGFTVLPAVVMLLGLLALRRYPPGGGAELGARPPGTGRVPRGAEPGGGGADRGSASTDDQEEQR